VASWVKTLGQGTGADTTLRFAPSTSNSIDITHANPSGLAQFLAGRRTRLSTLLHDADQFAVARRTARALDAKIAELWEERGIDVGYLAAGVSNWRATHDGRSEAVSAPIMLGRIKLTRHLDQDDYDVQLIGRATVSPAFTRQIEADHHFTVDTDAVHASAYSIARFDPVRGMDTLRHQLADVPGVVIGHRLLLSTFADLTDPADPAKLSGTHPVIQGLVDHAENQAQGAAQPHSGPKPAAAAAGKAAAAPAQSGQLPSEAFRSETPAGAKPQPGGQEKPAEKPEGAASGSLLRQLAERFKDGARGSRKEEAEEPAEPAAAAPRAPQPVHTGRKVIARSSDERDPADELYLLDADESQARVLDYVAAGESVTVNAAAGTGATQTALNAAALLAAQGKRVLVIAEQRSAAEEFVQRFNEKLDGACLLLEPNEDPEALRKQLTRAILRNERATEPQQQRLFAKLRENRATLQEHVRSLHSVRTRWDCSPYQAMQELARLSALEPAPSTTVRLKRSVLDSMGQREHVAAQLKRAAQLGAFSKEHTSSPWYGAPLRNQGQTEQALALASGLGRDLPVLHEHMLEIAQKSQIRLEETYEKWGEQLQLLVAVRGSLDKFEADIFEGDIDDLIAATASSQWRREHGVEMGSIVRSRLRKIAKEYVRPGMHVPDLQSALQAVSEQREAWRVYATSQRHPAVPGGLLDVEAGYYDAGTRIDALAEMLPPQLGDSLRDMPVQQLLETIASLVERAGDLKELPERTIISEQLAETGLGDLLGDFAEREIGTDQVDAELELAWWQSALEAMISGDDFLAMNDGAKLEKIEADYRLADAAHIAAGPERIRWALAENWKAALADHRAGSRELRALLKGGEPEVAEVLNLGQLLTNSLIPVWVAAPLLLGTALPEDAEFDAVILLEANYLTLREVLDAIRRSGQVIAVGDTLLGGPKPFEVSVDPTARMGERRTEVSALHALNQVLITTSLSTVYRGIDEGLVEQLSHAYYGDKLSRLPAASSLSYTAPLLSSEFVPDATGTLSSSEDGVQTTAAEVARVVDLVFTHFAQRAHESLAVIASNRAHAAAIAEAIRVQLPNHKYSMERFRDRSEPFVVTTMDRLIGLRRDAVIFAWGYGRTPHGKALHEFGALSRETGDELFVAAVTRARKRMVLVSGLLPQDVDMNRVYRGARQFFELFGRVHAGDSGVSSNRSLRHDPLVADLAKRLRERGAIVTEDYRGVLDLSAHVLDTGSGGIPPLAVVYDGTEHYSHLTVRERSRLRPDFFEGHGWRYVPLWTIDVFTDPTSVADRLASYLQLAKPEQSEPAPESRAKDPAAKPVAASSVTAPKPPEDHAEKGEQAEKSSEAKDAKEPAQPEKGQEADPAQADKAQDGSEEKAESKEKDEAQGQATGTPAPVPASSNGPGKPDGQK